MSHHYLKLLPLLALVPINAMAEPTLYPKPNNLLSTIHNTTDSNILADFSDPHTIWVMPPNTATAAVASMHTKTANMGFCREMGNLQGYTRDLSQQMADLSDVKYAQSQNLIKLQTRASQLNEEAEQFAATKNLSAILTLDTQIEVLDTNLQSLYEQSDKCTHDCELILEDIRTTMAAKKELLKQRSELSKQNSADVRTYEKKKAAATAAQKTAKDARSIYQELMTDIQKVRTDFLSSYDSFGKMEGARASLTYKSHWNDNLTTLRSLNSGINFAKIATKNAQLATELAGLGNNKVSGAIMEIGMGGSLQGSALKFAAYPEEMANNVVLSLIGACPMEHPEYFDLKNNDVSSMKYGVIISYDYSTMVNIKATASYNMYKIYTKILSSGSSGGLFSSSSWSNVFEKNFFKDSFSVTWDNSENAITPEEKEKIEAQLRFNVMSRLAAIALPVSADRAGIIAAAPPPPHGAAVIASTFAPCAPISIYCATGSAVASILDAIFGSSSSSANYTNINDIEVVDNYLETKKVTSSWITSYIP